MRKTVGRARLTYDELLTLITEAEMILNSRPISYVSADDTEEALTPSHILRGRRILSLPGPIGDIDETDDGDLGSPDLSRRLRHLEKTMGDFWRRWRTEYLHELREAHRNAKRLKGQDRLIAVGDMVVLYDEKHPRGFWRIGKVERLISGVDGEIRGASVRVHTNRINTLMLNRPIQHLYPLEVKATVVNDPNPDSQDKNEDSQLDNSLMEVEGQSDDVEESQYDHT